MKISIRLYLTVAPAILAVSLLAGLFYWGQYARSAPGIVLLIGAIAAAVSLGMTYANARYLSRRLERVVGAPHVDMGHDEIDEIESVMERLSGAVVIAGERSVDRERRFEQRANDYARTLATVADASIRRLEEVRLPLHILLENRFGELNENQEEMLGAARAAAEAADADMLSLRQIAALDLGERIPRQDRMKPSEIVEALRPQLMSAAESAGATLELDVAPLLPALSGDRALLQDALVTVLRDAVASTPADAAITMHVDRQDDVIRMVVRGAGIPEPSVRFVAAVRAIQAHAGRVIRNHDELTVELPIERSR